MKRLIILTAAAAMSLSASAIQVGDVLDFAADGGLQQVEVIHQTADDTFLGRLNDYELLNVSIVADKDGWIMNVDDWRNHRRIFVRLDANGKAVGEMDKGNGVRCAVDRVEQARQASAVVNAARRMAAKAASPAPVQVTHDYGDGSVESNTEGWNPDPENQTVDILIVFEKNAINWLRKNKGRTDYFNKDTSVIPYPEFVGVDGNVAPYPIPVPKKPEEVAKMLIANLNLALINSRVYNLKANLAGVMKLSAACGKQIKGHEATDEEYADMGLEGQVFLDDIVGEVAGNRTETAEPNRTYAVSIRKKREQLGADLVAVIFMPPGKVGSDEGGLSSFLMNQLDSDNGEKSNPLQRKFLWRETAHRCRWEGCYAMALIPALRDCTFTHETAHMFGCGHWQKQDFGPGPMLFGYSSGLMFRDTDNRMYHTIMGYEWDDIKLPDGSKERVSYPYEIMLFTSPALTNPFTGEGVIGDAETNDNARTLRETAPVVTQYRVAKARRNPRKGYGYKRGEPLDLDFSEYSGYKLSGKPSGMKWDKETGRLAGKPKSAGTFILKFVDGTNKKREEKFATSFETLVICR